MGSVEVDHLPLPGSIQEDLNLSPVRAADWSRVAAVSSGNPECSTTPKESHLATVRALGSAEEGHSNLVRDYLLAAASPLAKDESCPTLSTPGSTEERDMNLSTPGSTEERDLNLLYMMASYYVLAPASPLARDESCLSLSTPGSAEAGERDLNPLATLGRAASVPAPTNSQSMTTPGSSAYSSCLLSSSATHSVGSNVSVMLLSHPQRSLVLIQELQVRR